MIEPFPRAVAEREQAFMPGVTTPTNPMAINRLDRFMPFSPTGTKSARDALLGERHSSTDEGGLEETVARWASMAGEAIGRHPKVTVAAAIALGIALGWWVKRK